MQTYTDPCSYAMQSDMRQLKEMIASDLANYMLEMMPPLDMCVDFVCDRFGLDCTDELIDFVADCHDEFFGNWYKPMKFTVVKFKGRWVKVSNKLSPPTEWVTVINKANLK